MSPPNTNSSIGRTIHRGMNLPIRDESDDEDEVEENIKVEVVLNLEEERLFKAISKIGKKT